MLWEFFVNLIEATFFGVMIYSKLHYRFSKKSYFVIGIFLSAIIVTLINISSLEYFLSWTIFVGIDLALTFLYFKDTIAKKILWGCIPMLIALIANNIVMNIVLISKIDLENTLIPGEIRIPLTILYLFICGLIYWILYKIKKTEIKLPKILIVLIIVILLIGILATAQLAYIFAQTFDLLSIFISLELLILLIAAFALFEMICKTISDKTKVEVELARSYLEEKNIRQTKESIRAWKHDYHNHLETMKGLLHSEKYSELADYLGKVDNDFSELTTKSFLSNSAIDAMLFSKLLLARTNNIDLDIRANGDIKLPITETKMCVLLGNLVDNALEACKSLDFDNPQIKLSIFTRQGMLFINITNPSNGIYHFSNKKLETTKQSQNHGYGLKRIAQIIKEANGYYEVFPEPNLFKFIGVIPCNREKS